MKIVILGTSGSGKSTLAQTLGERYGIPVLHLDAVHFLPGWVERSREEETQLVTQFMDEHDSWAIDGNYTRTCYERRLEEADQILVLYFNRFACLWRVFCRWWNNRGKVRDSAAPGCEEKLDAEFVWWILYQGRTTKKREDLAAVGRKYSEKVVYLKNQCQLDTYRKQLK